MEPSEIVVGLDIGTTKIVAIVGRRNEFGKIEILGMGKSESYGVARGVVQNIDQTVQAIRTAVADAENKSGVDIKVVNVGIAGQHIKSLQTRGDRVRTNVESEISKEDIELLVRDQYRTYIPAGDQIIDIIPQDFTVDSTPYVVDPIGMSGVKIGANFHIITGDRNAIRNIKRCVDKSRLVTRDLVLQPLASAAAVISASSCASSAVISLLFCSMRRCAC